MFLKMYHHQRFEVFSTVLILPFRAISAIWKNSFFGRDFVKSSAGTWKRHLLQCAVSPDEKKDRITTYLEKHELTSKSIFCKFQTHHL